MVVREAAIPIAAGATIRTINTPDADTSDVIVTMTTKLPVKEHLGRQIR
jgi:hypothetical protein